MEIHKILHNFSGVYEAPPPFSQTLNRQPRIICMHNMKLFHEAVSEKYRMCIHQPEIVKSTDSES